MSRLKYYVLSASLIVLAGVLPRASGQQVSQNLPLVLGASVPLYPRAALLAHIIGNVKLRVSTDGTRISDVQILSGPPMLARAAQENIRTWQFKEHNPTVFLVTFEYRIEDPAGCAIGNSEAVLHMPLRVQISAKGVHTCDPASEVPRATTH
jgi:hypothetical protein